MVTERYYTCTTDGHNKDYLFMMDTDRLVATATWGPIGGDKQVDKYKASNVDELNALAEEKHARRLRHGYKVEWTREGLASVSAEFEADLRDMLAAERIG